MNRIMWHERDGWKTRERLIGVVLDKKDIECLLLLEDGIVSSKDDAKLWENLFSIGAVKNKYHLRKWFKIDKIPVLTWIGEDIIDEYRWRAEIDPKMHEMMYIEEEFLGNRIWKSLKALFGF